METLNRRAAVKVGVRLELVTIVWMAIEAAVAIGAGVAARSLLLTAFGFDSIIELISGTTLLWRLSAEANGSDVERVDRIERRATWISAGLLALLCVYVIFVGIGGLLARVAPEGSALGVAVSALAVVVMPLLAWRKRLANRSIGSAALSADITETMTCAYMGGATLVGVALNLFFGLWWAEYVAALVLLVFLAGETREAFESARGRSD